MPPSSKNSTKQGQLKSILRVTDLCSNVKNKAVRFCDELNQILLITPRQILRRSQRRKNKSQQESEPVPEPVIMTESDEPAHSESESDPMNESYLTQRAKKISKRLRKSVQTNNSRAQRSEAQCEYYDRVVQEAERRVLNSKTISISTVYDYMERISLLETDLWSEMFMPTKPFLSDINNDTLVMFIKWLKACAAPLFKNNNVSKRVRNAFMVSRDLNYDQLVSKNLDQEPRTTIVYGHTGSGKTQLVYCAAESTGFDVFELAASDLRSSEVLEETVKRAEAELSLAFNHSGRKRSEFKIPLIFLDDADVYFEADKGYMQYLTNLIRTTKLPLVLTATSQAFATKLCEEFDESHIQLMKLDYTADDLIFQVQHFISTLFVSDFNDQEVANIVEAAGNDIRSTLNILQFFYAPVIMRPLHEHDVPSELFDVPLPKFEHSKSKVDARYLAELQYEVYRCGLMRPKENSEVFMPETGYMDQLMDERHSALNEIYSDMYNGLASDYNSE